MHDSSFSARLSAHTITLHSLIVIAALCMLVMSQANASVVYTGSSVDMYLNKNIFEQGLPEEKVFLDGSSLNEVTGHVGSQSDPRLVSITSATDMLNAGNGFATIKAEDGLINSITITTPGYWFENIKFTLDLTAGPGQPPQSNDDLVITTLDATGSVDIFSDWTMLDNWRRGNNRIQIFSTDDNPIASVTITSQLGMQTLGGLNQLKQIELSGLTAVPVPAAAWLFGSGLIGLIGIARRYQS